MLEFETDSDTHFKCPQCGQQGSVPTHSLKQALAETPHVHISCSACGHQFEPFAEKPTSPAQAADDALSSQWQQGAAPAIAPDGQTDGEAGEAPASLPSWLMPSGKNIALPETEVKDDTETETEAAREDAGETEIEADRPIEHPIAPEEDTDAEDADAEDADAADLPAEDLPPPTPEDAESDADQAPENEPMADAPEEDDRAETEAPEVSETPEATDAIEANEPNEPATVYDDTAPAMPLRPTRRDPVGWVNGVLLLVVVLLVGMNVFILSGDETPSRATPSGATTPMPLAQMASSNFKIIPDANDNSVEVSVSFTNKDTQRAVIGDFRINLQNEARETLLSWTVLSSGETVTGGTTRTVSSTLFGPPAALAHVAIDYPLKN